MTGHTPGPWYVVTGPPNGVAVHWSLDGQICPLRWTDGLRPEVERRVMADARLIASAPELLAALKAIAEVWNLAIVAGNINGDTENSAIADAAARAIHKAEAGG
jgi:hypothetical protein